MQFCYQTRFGIIMFLTEYYIYIYMFMGIIFVYFRSDN